MHFLRSTEDVTETLRDGLIFCSLKSGNTFYYENELQELRRNQSCPQEAQGLKPRGLEGQKVAGTLPGCFSWKSTVYGDRWSTWAF